MLQLAGQDEDIRRRSLHLEKWIVRDVEVDLTGMRFRRRKNRVETSLTEDVPDEAGHGVLDLLPFQLGVGLGLHGALDELFASEVEEDVHGADGDDYFVDGKGAWVG